MRVSAAAKLVGHQKLVYHARNSAAVAQAFLPVPFPLHAGILAHSRWRTAPVLFVGDVPGFHSRRYWQNDRPS